MDRLQAEATIRALAGGAHPMAGDTLVRGTESWEFRNLQSETTSVTPHKETHQVGGGDELELNFSQLTVASLPATLAGHGINDAYTKAEANGLFRPLATEVPWTGVSKAGATPGDVGAAPAIHGHPWSEINKFGAFPADIGAATEEHFHNWLQVTKGGSSLADLETRSAGDLTSGILLDDRLSTNIPRLNVNNTYDGVQIYRRPASAQNAYLMRTQDPVTLAWLDSFAQTAGGRSNFRWVAGAAITAAWGEVASGKMGMPVGTHLRVPALEVGTTEIISAARVITGCTFGGSMRGAAIADVSGGAVIDVEARAAINALLAQRRARGDQA